MDNDSKALVAQLKQAADDAANRGYKLRRAESAARLADSFDLGACPALRREPARALRAFAVKESR